ncbi:MAG: hypothetical protein A2143_06280 [Gallionellales bacterium RBG_16_57_15]|nr:MAG: hypothetical protein A2143_06280 [Gallionellales bacterium RBG_16_57_15]
MEYKTINLTDARPGMQVALDVCTANGSVLLAAGAVLSMDTLAALARRGVGQLQIAESLSPEQRAERAAAFEQRLAVLFRHAGDDPLLGKLREIVRDYRLGGL